MSTHQPLIGAVNVSQKYVPRRLPTERRPVSIRARLARDTSNGRKSYQKLIVRDPPLSFFALALKRLGPKSMPRPN